MFSIYFEATNNPVVDFLVVRFPFLLDLLPPEKVASIIVKAVRREYKEVSIPRAMLTMDRLSR